MARHNRFLMLASMGLAATIGLNGCGSKPAQSVLPAGSTVIALGDSLTYGYGASDDTAYPRVLAKLSKWTVINAGGNDVLQRMAPDTTRSNIIATIDSLQSKNIDIVLIAEPHLSTSALFGKASDHPLYEDIAEAKGIPLYSDGWSNILSDDALKSDRIHANAAGYRQFAEGLYDYLQEEGVAR